MSLIELMVAMVLGLILVFGASTVYLESRRSSATNETVARLQESARYAMAILEPDIRMSNYWGLMKGAAGITGQSLQTAAANALGGASNACGRNFALDLLTNIEGSNDAFVLGVAPSGCPLTGTPLATGDTLTIRRASSNPTPAGPLRICSSRVSGQLVANSAGCAGAPTGQVNDLIVHSYYVSTNSSLGANVPSLHRLTLFTLGGGPAFRDDEIIQGIEDMQVQFGIEGTGTNTGVVTHYVDPAVAGAIPGQIVTVRIWLLVRSETPEVDFVDDKPYVYGNRIGVTGTADLANTGERFLPGTSTGTALTDVRHYRRLLVSRTINVRNALGT